MEVLSINVTVGLNHLSYCLDKTDHIRRAPLTGAVKYYKNRQKLSEEYYKAGKLDGLYVWWHPNGNKMFEKYYRNGKN